MCNSTTWWNILEVYRTQNISVDRPIDCANQHYIEPSFFQNSVPIYHISQICFKDSRYWNQPCSTELAITWVSWSHHGSSHHRTEREDSRGHLAHPMVQNKIIYHCSHSVSCSLTCSNDVRIFPGKKPPNLSIYLSPIELLKSSPLNLQSITSLPVHHMKQLFPKFWEVLHSLSPSSLQHFPVFYSICFLL